jgi:spore germination cell wall hydrolase CwlJ-like protein
MAEFTPRNKYLAQLLSQGMDTSPIASPYQGLSRMAFALLAGKEMGDDERNQREAMSEIIKAINGPSPTQVAPATPANQLARTLARPADVNADAVTEAKTPQDYINRGFGMSPTDREVATRTVLGEAANQGQGGMNAVADVIRNRADNGGYGGRSMSAVALAPNQFEPHNTQAGRQRMASFSDQSPQYKGAQEAVDSAGVGSRPDVTGGAHYFFAPKAQAALAPVDGRPVTPSFAAGREPTAVIGDHNFYGPRTQMAQAQPQQAQAQFQPGQRPGMNDSQVQQLRDLAEKGKKNPHLLKMATGLAQNAINERFKPADYDIKVENGMVFYTNKKDPRDSGVVNNPETARMLIQQKAAEKYAETAASRRAEKDINEPDRRRHELTQGGIVVQDIDRALKETKDAKIPVTGLVGQAASYIPGTAAHNVSKLVDTIKSNAGFQQLQQMRQSSPTGGALGSITERELYMLQAAIGNLEQSQDEKQFKDNLKRVKNIYMDIIHGQGNGPREELDFQKGESKASGKTSTGIGWSVN